MEFTRRDFLRMSATATLLCPLSSLTFLKEPQAGEAGSFWPLSGKDLPVA